MSAAAVLFVAVMFTAFFGAPYVPSKKREIRQAFKQLYPLTHRDTVVDLGSGDGIVLRVARECGAVAIGYELSPLLVVISKLLARGDSKQRIITKNYWHVDFPPQTTVVYAFSDGRDIAKMYRLITKQAGKLQRELMFISYGIAVPGVAPAKTQGAYFLYAIAPCGEAEA